MISLSNDMDTKIIWLEVQHDFDGFLDRPRVATIASFYNQICCLLIGSIHCSFLYTIFFNKDKQIPVFIDGRRKTTCYILRIPEKAPFAG